MSFRNVMEFYVFLLASVLSLGTLADNAPKPVSSVTSQNPTTIIKPTPASSTLRNTMTVIAFTSTLSSIAAFDNSTSTTAQISKTMTVHSAGISASVSNISTTSTHSTVQTTASTVPTVSTSTTVNSASITQEKFSSKGGSGTSITMLPSSHFASHEPLAPSTHIKSVQSSATHKQTNMLSSEISSRLDSTYSKYSNSISSPSFPSKTVSSIYIDPSSTIDVSSSIMNITGSNCTGHCGHKSGDQRPNDKSHKSVWVIFVVLALVACATGVVCFIRKRKCRRPTGFVSKRASYTRFTDDDDAELDIRL